MSVDWAGLLGLLGPVSLCIALVVIGLLSRRLGSVIRTPHYYLGFFLAAALLTISILARLLNLGRGPAVAAALNRDPVWVFLYTGLPLIAALMGAVTAWRYWSWLLAERS
ncbi:MAG: hypothetical protein DWB42_17350 [Chloroflexi bacterium]|nr:hypothetical protein [Chloroflexota bacterium]MDL1885519.1 hypothetical protein [Anaerolineae bacterium CFX8]